METIVADIAIVQALQRSETIETLVEHRIFNTMRPEYDEQEDKIPYIVVTYEGMTNDNDTKDSIEGDEDVERVNVLIVAQDRVQLSNIVNAARTAIREYLSDSESWNDYRTAIRDYLGGDAFDTYGIADYSVSASAVLGDWTVPCTYQSLNYTIHTNIQN